MKRHLVKKADVRSQLTAVVGQIANRKVTSTIELDIFVLHATRFEDFAVNVDDLRTPRPLVEVVDVLGYDGDIVVFFQFGQAEMAGIWFGRGDFPSPHVIKVEHDLRLPGQCHWGADVFDVVPGPESVAIAESLDSRLARNSRSGKDHNVHVSNSIAHNRVAYEFFCRATV